MYDIFYSSGGGNLIPYGKSCSYPYITYVLPNIIAPQDGQVCGPLNTTAFTEQNLGIVGYALWEFLGNKYNYTNTLWSWNSVALVPTESPTYSPSISTKPTKAPNTYPIKSPSSSGKLETSGASGSSSATGDMASNTMILAIVVPLVALLFLATAVYFFYFRRATTNGEGRSFPLIDYFYKHSENFAADSPMDTEVSSRPNSMTA